MYYKVCDKYFVLSVCSRRSCDGDAGAGPELASANAHLTQLTNATL